MSDDRHDNLPAAGGGGHDDEIEARPGRFAEPADPMDNPGLPEHLPRPTDVYPEQERRAERQVAGMFTLASVLGLVFCVLYFVVPIDATFLGWSGLNLALGGTLGLALLLIGVGAVQWAKKLMADEEMVEMRHPAHSDDESVAEMLEKFNQGADESGIRRRPLIRNSLLASLGVLGLPAIVLLRDLGPLPGTKQFETVWAPGVRVVNDVAGTPIRPGDVEVGQLINAQPAVFFETDEDGEALYHGAELLAAKSKASVIVVRMRPEDINPAAGQENWGVEGILCFSKICTHVGCPISLWEQQTHHLLCPCHQSTYDLSDGGRVIFGPAHRPLPQLPMAVDQEGYLIATRDFTVPVGPSFPEIHQDKT